MKSKYKILIAIAALIVVAMAILAWLIFAPMTSETRMLHVRKGDNARTIANKLYDLGLIRNRFVFVQLVKLSRSDRFLKAGSYVFEGNAGMLEAVNRLRQGKSTGITITFPEGLSLYRTLHLIDKSGLAKYDSLYKVATDTAFVRQHIGLPLTSVEGFLYPETYRFDIDASPDSILVVMITEFRHRTKAAGYVISDSTDFYQTLILASIVEKEAGSKEEMPRIAGVFSNRLRRGMKMESCPTVDYVLERKGIRKAVLSYRDTGTPSPYNTYLVEGLPPTPICNPSLSALQAASTPQKHSYLYFFADRQGNNVFSGSYEEHLAKQRSYRKKS